jgi:hypothetical protein
MRGTGPWAQLLRARFELACRRLNFERERGLELATQHFRAPRASGQLEFAL